MLLHFCCLLVAPPLRGTDPSKERLELLSERKAPLNQIPLQGIRRCTRDPPQEDASGTGCPHLSQRRPTARPLSTARDVMNTNVSVPPLSCETANKAVDTPVPAAGNDLADNWQPDKAGKANTERNVVTFRQPVHRVDNVEHSKQPKSIDAELNEPGSSNCNASEGVQISDEGVSARAPKRKLQRALAFPETPSPCTVLPLESSGNESGAGITRRKATRRTVTEESMDESDEGMWDYRCVTRTISTGSLQGDDAERTRNAIMTGSSTTAARSLGDSHLPSETRIVPYGPHELAIVEETKYKCKSCMILDTNKVIIIYLLSSTD